MHIQDEEFRKFHEGVMEPDRIISILEHTKDCDYCAERFMNMKSDEMLVTPNYLKDKMIKRTQMLDVKAEVQIKATSKNVQLLLYGLKTTAAVLGALLLLFSVGHINTTNYVETVNKTNISSNWSDKLFDKKDSIVETMNKYSDEIINGGLNK